MLGPERERHRPAVFGAAYRLLGSVADAQDVTQDVWLRAAGADLQHIALAPMDGPGGFTSTFDYVDVCRVK